MIGRGVFSRPWDGWEQNTGEAEREGGVGFPGSGREAVQASEACEVLPRHVSAVTACATRPIQR